MHGILAPLQITTGRPDRAVGEMNEVRVLCVMQCNTASQRWRALSTRDRSIIIPFLCRRLFWLFLVVFRYVVAVCLGRSVSRGQIFFCIIIYINYNRERLGKMCSIRAYLASSRAWMQAEHRSGEGLCCLRMKGRRAERRGGLLTCLFSPQLHRTSLRGGTMGAISLRGGTVGRTVCLSGKDSCHLRHINK